MTKISLIGSTRYKNLMEKQASMLRAMGGEVRLPFYDSLELDEIEIALKNRENILWADRIYIYWDGASLGTVFDFGMVFMSGKELRIGHINDRSMSLFMESYALGEK